MEEIPLTELNKSWIRLVHILRSTSSRAVMERMERLDMSSYPPPFRHPNLYKQPSGSDPPPSNHPNHQNLDLPIIDLQNPNAQILDEACRNWGLFRLINHGIPQALSNQVRCLANSLFSLPFESKKAQSTQPITYFWGTPTLSQSVQNLNWVEGFHVRLADLSQEDKRLDEPISESFRSLLEEYGEHMGRIGRELFDVLAENLNLKLSQRASYLSESNGLLRVYRYPCGPEGDQVFGMDAHTDSSVLSILNQDEVGGLQVLKDQKWVQVAPIMDTLIVNLGDMIQAMSNDEYKSVEHRVMVNRRRERMSICYFAFPVEDGVIDSPNYKAFTYKEFKAQVQEDIKATGFKVGLQRFKVGKHE